MRGRNVIVALGLFGVAPSAAIAADLGQLTCPAEEMTAAERTALGRMAAEQGSGDDQRMVPLREAVGRCATRLSWNEELIYLSLLYTLGDHGASALREEFAAAGIDLAPLVSAIVSDGPLMEAARRDQVSEEVGIAFTTRHSALIGNLLGRRLAEPAWAEKLGNFIGFRAIMEASRGRFAER